MVFICFKIIPTLFQAILSDISSHVSRLQSEYSDAHRNDSELITSIRSRLATQASRCWQVQSSLSLQKAQHDQEIAGIRLTFFLTREFVCLVLKKVSVFAPTLEINSE